MSESTRLFAWGVANALSQPPALSSASPSISAWFRWLMRSVRQAGLWKLWPVTSKYGFRKVSGGNERRLRMCDLTLAC